MPSEERKADRPLGLLMQGHRQLNTIADALSRLAYRVPLLRTSGRYTGDTDTLPC